MIEVKDFLELAKKRISCRNYSDAPVPDKIIDYCLESACYAPSACNQQPWRFIIIKDKKTRHNICKNGLLPGLPMPWLKSAPVIVVLCTVPSAVTHHLAPVLSGIKYDLIDAGIAGEHFILAATEQNLSSCWIGWFKAKTIKKILNIPKDVRVASLISLGYPKNYDEERKVQKNSIDKIKKMDTW